MQLFLSALIYSLLPVSKIRTIVIDLLLSD